MNKPGISSLKKKAPKTLYCNWCEDSYSNIYGYGDFCSKECYELNFRERAMEEGYGQDFDADPLSFL